MLPSCVVSVRVEREAQKAKSRGKGNSHFDQGQDQPAFSPDREPRGVRRRAAEDQVAAADQPGGRQQPTRYQPAAAEPQVRTNQDQPGLAVWAPGNDQPRSRDHGRQAATGGAAVRISGWFVVGPAFAPTSRVETRLSERKLSKRLESGLTSAGLVLPARAPTRRCRRASWLRARAG